MLRDWRNLQRSPAVTHEAEEKLLCILVASSASLIAAVHISLCNDRLTILNHWETFWMKLPGLSMMVR